MQKRWLYDAEGFCKEKNSPKFKVQKNFPKEENYDTDTPPTYVSSKLTLQSNFLKNNFIFKKLKK